MKTLRVVTAGLIAVCLSMMAVVASGQQGNGNTDRDRDNRLSARLAGINEVPSVSTAAGGSFKATISADETEIDYELTFSGLQGVIAQSHIHIARPGVNGGIVLWLCKATAVPADAAISALTPVCPQDGTVTGTLRAANITPVATQQILANELDEIIALIRAGAAYVNVHTSLSPGGEIRGQVGTGNGNSGHGGR
jgi:CHRD domain